MFGLDRRSLLPGLAVIALFVLWTIVLPGVNGALGYDDETEAGDVFALAAGITMDAEPGWEVASGLRTTDRTRSQAPGEDVALTGGGVLLTVTTGPYRGSTRRLLSQIERLSPTGFHADPIHVAGAVKAFRTDQGERGLAQGYTTVGGEGVAAALVLAGRGVQVLATGPDAPLQSSADELELMIDSIRFDPRAGQ